MGGDLALNYFAEDTIIHGDILHVTISHVKYSIRPQLTPDERNGLVGVPDLSAHLLFHRGITDARSADKFITPDYDRDTHDPFLLKDAEKSATRIVQAIRNDEKIAIYSDYDADGIPGASLFKDFFDRIGFKNFVVYIPHRHNEGFGLNEEAVEQLASQGVKLLITIDCGISDKAAVARANELGLQVIVTDHHEPPPELPPAFAIIDHKQSGCAYPDKNLCGSGVAFKLIQAILAKDRFGLKEGHEKWLLDLVGIATLSDMVSLTGENRVFAHYGLQVIHKAKRRGLRQLFLKLRIMQEYATEDDIAFMITPRINAASRMGVPMDAFNLLTAETDEAAIAGADILDAVNTERKGVVAVLVKEVKKTVRERHGERVPSVIVLGNPAWRPSLLGLAANSCAEEFRRPVFLWGRDGDNVIKGSCRSEGTTHVVELMRAATPETFMQFGGHKHSGGFEIDNDEIHFIEQRLNNAAELMVQAKVRGSVRTESDGASPAGLENAAMGEADEMIDAEMKLDQVNYSLYNEIAKLAPFGVGNPKPVFLFKNVMPTAVRIFGKGSEHVELLFTGKNGSKIPAISFFGVTEPWASVVAANKPIDLVASVEKSMFRNRPELRLRIADVITS